MNWAKVADYVSRDKIESGIEIVKEKCFYNIAKQKFYGKIVKGKST